MDRHRGRPHGPGVHPRQRARARPRDGAEVRRVPPLPQLQPHGPEALGRHHHRGQRQLARRRDHDHGLDTGRRQEGRDLLLLHGVHELLLQLLVHHIHPRVDGLAQQLGQLLGAVDRRVQIVHRLRHLTRVHRRPLRHRPHEGLVDLMVRQRVQLRVHVLAVPLQLQELRLQAPVLQHLGPE